MRASNMDGKGKKRKGLNQETRQRRKLQGDMTN